MSKMSEWVLCGCLILITAAIVTWTVQPFVEAALEPSMGSIVMRGVRGQPIARDLCLRVARRGRQNGVDVYCE